MVLSGKNLEASVSLKHLDIRDHDDMLALACFTVWLCRWDIGCVEVKNGLGGL